MNVPNCAEALNLWLTAGGQIDQQSRPERRW
jgi:hypothetical protein